MQTPSEFFEKYMFSLPEESENTDLILRFASDEFMDFWTHKFGKPKKNDDIEAYTEKMVFVMIGWLGKEDYVQED